MAIQSYRELKVWQKAMTLACSTYDVTTRFPTHERFGITGQLRRAAVSVATNIAEGHGRSTSGEFRNQLSVSRGSLNEVETLYLIARRLGYVKKAEAVQIAQLCDEISRMLTVLKRRIQ
jgi:four helix bundle protein